MEKQILQKIEECLDNLLLNRITRVDRFDGGWGGGCRAESVCPVFLSRALGMRRAAEFTLVGSAVQTDKHASTHTQTQRECHT